MSHTVISLTNQVRKARHLVRLMTQNSESCAKVIPHMTHKCESWKHHKSHTYEIQNPMPYNRESYETISSLSQICDISSSLPLGESLRLLPKVHSPSAYPSHFL